MTPADEPAVIGLLGGMSWPSTLTYYRAVNEGVGKVLGGSHSARMVIWSQDYAEVERRQLAEDWEGAGELLAEEPGGSRQRARTCWPSPATPCTASPAPCASPATCP